MKPQVPPGPVPPLPWPVVLLTGLVVSLPRLPLLLRLPISVCELDCDIPSKNGLRQRSIARVSGRWGPERQPVDSWVELVFRKDLVLGVWVRKDTAEAGQGPGLKAFGSVLSGLLSPGG